MRRVLVLGAGLAGLAAARALAERGVEATVLEQESEPGGACRTVHREGFDFDHTGHLLHLHRPESRPLLAGAGVLPLLRRHRRRAGVHLAGVVTPYPVQIHTRRLPPAVRRDCVLGFVEALLSGQAPAPPEASFAEWALSRFGVGLARHFFLPYNRKLFGRDPVSFTAEWTGPYVPRPGLAEVIDGAFGLHRGAVGYNAEFYYPRRGGIRALPDALARDLPGLRPLCRVRRLGLAARELELDSGEVLRWDALVATAALPALAALADDLPVPARQAAARLVAVDVWNLNLGVVGPAPRREHWLYVPEPGFPFYRVGLPSNHGATAPRGCHSLSVEVSLPAGTPVPTGLREGCLVGLEELGLLPDRGAVVCEVELRVAPGYVVFDPERAAAVGLLRGALEAAGVVLAGRWAEWSYSVMEDALASGVAAAGSALR